MAHMSYCRFRNTLKDLHDCQAHMNDNDLSEAENLARQQLIALCAEIAADFTED